MMLSENVIEGDKPVLRKSCFDYTSLKPPFTAAVISPKPLLLSVISYAPIKRLIVKI